MSKNALIPVLLGLCIVLMSCTQPAANASTSTPTATVTLSVTSTATETPTPMFPNWPYDNDGRRIVPEVEVAPYEPVLPESFLQDLTNLIVKAREDGWWAIKGHCYVLMDRHLFERSYDITHYPGGTLSNWIGGILSDYDGISCIATPIDYAADKFHHFVVWEGGTPFQMISCKPGLGARAFFRDVTIALWFDVEVLPRNTQGPNGRLGVVIDDPGIYLIGMTQTQMIVNLPTAQP